MKTPITYYGGKQQMLPEILPLIPAHDIYTEAFIGGGAVFWAKPKAAKLEVINDLNRQLTTFYKVVKERFPELKKLVNQTLHSRRVHNDAWLIYQNPHLFTEVQLAWSIWCLSVQGFSGQLGASWGYDKSNSVMVRKIGNKKHEFTAELMDRLEAVQVECTDALKVIRLYDGPSAFHYVDPPYYNSACGHYDGYSQADFEELLALLADVKGCFLLSSYPSEVLAEATKRYGWHTKQISKRVAVTPGAKHTKVEVLTANYEL